MTLFQHRSIRILAVALSCLAAAAVTPVADAKKGGSDAGQRLADRAEIADLTYCYAEGTDAIGRGDLAAGKATYKECFTTNAKVAAYFPGADPNGPPGLSAVGTDAWAVAVQGVFETNGYISTQHLLSNIRIDLDGNSGTMTSYLSATHVIDPAGAVELAHGTYVDTVVRTPQGWRISKRTLYLISFLRLESPAP
ncbi:nuclear transport factor 2 family protein [Nannocystis radixulma]|uniref:Nuclear transport factor 2 family protein n=1 Tax=Nannocystis radixulma TaxID=2995305 RepID=A0ABT5BMP3_9BACT|nr:nuclear transport factor 2 family protein [Nannocystis radixulma]MDC0674943.1 nuclear transport factor 2 family protein [Nannocystis radixulma]